MTNHSPRIPLGATVSHPLDRVCWLCTTCAECGHVVEDDAHAAGCDECSCPLSLRPDDDS